VVKKRGKMVGKESEQVREEIVMKRGETERSGIKEREVRGK